MQLDVRKAQAAEIKAILLHVGRHMAENTQASDLPFAPYAANDPIRVEERAEEWVILLSKSSAKPGFGRMWGLFNAENECLGHVDLRSSPMATLHHRVELGIGIERSHRGQGHGRRLMNTALEFAQNCPHLRWVDLCVFSHQQRARALYQDMSFVENGLVKERFLIDGMVVDDVSMTLFVG
ncbi:MAG: GNAT family N-acetyltransferase [Deltaproteobacteria bacterium]|nr:GNAT family N-acetyltransferase [Deltaproteobacteria bacterium]